MDWAKHRRRTRYLLLGLVIHLTFYVFLAYHAANDHGWPWLVYGAVVALSFALLFGVMTLNSKPQTRLTSAKPETLKSSSDRTSEASPLSILSYFLFLPALILLLLAIIAPPIFFVGCLGGVASYCPQLACYCSGSAADYWWIIPALLVSFFSMVSISINSAGPLSHFDPIEIKGPPTSFDDGPIHRCIQ